ncbi:MAG: hypothetical protein J7M40_08435, partial [Planctomycetes bacterium]|nr:hypothetical protein [Planctomycetota bacterium]
MNKPVPVYLPSNEPYLGHPTLLEFDQAIPKAIQTHVCLAQSTFQQSPTPLQRAAAQLISQSVSIALSIR